MVDLHAADLSAVLHDDALAWIEASAVEKHRVDFKEHLPLQLDGIVEMCCAFAIVHASEG